MGELLVADRCFLSFKLICCLAGHYPVYPLFPHSCVVISGLSAQEVSTER